MSTVTLTIIIIAIYLGISVFIGAWVSKKYKMTTVADIFTASKSLGILALAFAVFGSQITAFGILGGPGLAYNFGYSALGYIVGPIIIGSIIFFIIGYRTWIISSKKNYVTPVQFFGPRFENNSARFVVALAQIVLLIPYVVTCGIGAGAIISTLTGGLIPYWAGVLIILLICSWTAYSGGMRATAYTNIFQGLLIFVTMFLMIFFTFKGIGGAEAIKTQLSTKLVSLGGKGIQDWKQWIPYSFLATGISNGVFAHMLVRNMSAKSGNTIKQNGLMYPILISLFWVMAILLGTWGSIAVPGLTASTRENIVLFLSQKFAPSWMIGVLGAGILACIMTSWDGMILTMSSVFSEDFYKPMFCKNKNLTENQQKNISKVFIIIVSVLIFILVMWKPSTILNIATFSFAAMATVVPAYFACLYWKKASSAGTIASVIVGPVLCALWAFNILPASTTLGFFYGLPAFVISIVVLIAVSLITKKPSQEAIDDFFAPYKEVYDD